MTGPPTMAVAHYPEGAGHATRMVAIANALQQSGVDVEMAGGGAGTEFVSLNGYDEFEPTAVDYVETYQQGSLFDVFTRNVPATAARVTEYVDWLRDIEPDGLVTDDMFAAIAAARSEVPLYVVKHDVPGLYQNRLERAGAAFHTSFQLAAAREFFYPTVWPPSAADPDGASRVPPIALTGDGRSRPAPEVVVVPSQFSDLGRLAGHLGRQCYDVLDVGRDAWDPVASLLPYLREADVVVCSGYSTVMEAAVAGTPCVVYPATDEQAAVADWLARFDVTGFAVAREPLDVLDAVASPPDPPTFDNGARVIADAVIDDIERAGTAGTARADRPGRDYAGPAAHSAGRVPTVEAPWRVADALVAASTAGGTAVRATTLHARTAARSTQRRLRDGLGSAGRGVGRGVNAAAALAGSAAAALLAAGRAGFAGWHRYRTASVALATAVGIVAANGLRRLARRPGVGGGRAAPSPASVIDRAVGGGRALRSAVSVINDRLGAVGQLTFAVDESTE